MNSFSVSDTRATKSGWNVTAIGQTGTGKSAVFAQYCPKSLCGSDAEGYVTSGQKMAAKSLKLSSTGASFIGGTGSAPTFQCSTACNVAAGIRGVREDREALGPFSWRRIVGMVL